jgi:hypothetical protein
VLLTSACVPLAKAMMGDSYTPLNAANAHIGIGDSTAAAAKGQTDLQAASNKAYLAMDSSYPQRSGAAVTFQVTADGSTANYAWNEFLVCDGSPGTAWSRFVQQLNGGVAKSAGQIWTLQVTVTMGRNDSAN